MSRHSLPIVIYPSLAARRLLGPGIDDAAGIALRTLLKERRSLEIAHQQIVYRSHHLAFSSRIGTQGDLILVLDIGDPKLAERVVLEDDLRRKRKDPTPRR